MEQMQSVPVSLPIVQVYQPSVSIHPSLHTQGKMSYQDSDPLQMPVSHNISNQLLSQNQTVISCQQIQLQNVQTIEAQTQVLHNDINQQLQITSHVIVPQVPMYKQHLLTGTVQHQYYGQYVEYLNEHLITKVEETRLNEEQPEKQTESAPYIAWEITKEVSVKKRIRSDVSNPSKWACNIRKLKHQKGEAYISRRGKYVPEKHIRNTKDCLKACRFKCNERIDDNDRHTIFEAFYSLNTNEKKHFLLSTTERHQVRNTDKMEGKRNYTFKYFFLIRSDRHVVCKNFYLGTLAISQKPVYNVHLNKSDINLPKPDGRGLSESSVHALPNELKDGVRRHIVSFTTLDSKPIKQYSRKRQYLDSCLNIKYMFSLYSNECAKDNVVPVKESMYRKIFHDEFNLHFKKKKANFCFKCKEPLKKS